MEKTFADAVDVLTDWVGVILNALYATVLMPFRLLDALFDG